MYLMPEDGENYRKYAACVYGATNILWLTAICKPIFNLILSNGKNFTKKKFRAHIRRNVAGSIPYEVSETFH